MDNNINVNKRAPDWWIFIILFMVATGLIVGIWVWKSIQISNVKEQSQMEMLQLKIEMKAHFLKSDELHLKAMAKPLVWAVRSGMLKNNISQVNIYANEMVKEKNFQKILVTNKKGLVVLSTNKKEEGKEFKHQGKFNYKVSDTTVVEILNDSMMVMSSPVMGFNNRLGTLIVTYSTQYPELK